MITIKEVFAKYWLCTLHSYIVVFGLSIAHMVVPWMKYKDGHSTLWQDCFYPNVSCDNVVVDCRDSTVSGPVWLEACRAMACFTIVFYCYMHYSTVKWNDPPSLPITLIGQIQAWMPLISYFCIGALMLSSGVIYGLKYEDYYTEEGKEDGIQIGPAVIIAYVGGSTTIVITVFISISCDLGLKAYLKDKLKFISRTTNSQESQQNVEIKSRCSVCLAAMKICFKKKRTSNTNNSSSSSSNYNNNTNNDNNNNNNNTDAQQSSNENRSAPRQRSVTIMPRPGQNQQNSTSNIFVIGNEINYLSSVSNRSASIHSISRLTVEERSISGNQNDNNNVTPSQLSIGNSLEAGQVTSNEESNGNPPQYQSPAPTTLSYFDCGNGDPDYAPPSYEDVINSDSRC